MADGTLRLPTEGLGKHLQTFENLVDGEVVNAEGVVLVDSTGAPLGSFPLPAAQEKLLADAKRALTDYEVRFDYDTNTDARPVYIGKALQGSPLADPVWSIQRLEYDVSDRVVRIQVLSGITWDGRVAAGWS